ncbi:hypothetical protein HK102_010863 [Quaeritorhiza haematococci]|nr:hypothetical protein HK102_010863 [Quaeritorhiza haematococci]
MGLQQGIPERVRDAIPGEIVERRLDGTVLRDVLKRLAKWNEEVFKFQYRQPQQPVQRQTGRFLTSSSGAQNRDSMAYELVEMEPVQKVILCGPKVYEGSVYEQLTDEGIVQHDEIVMLPDDHWI